MTIIESVMDLINGLMNKNIINPQKISKAELPLIVFSADDWDLFNFGIGWRTRGLWKHVMMMISQGEFVSQDVIGYRKVPIEKYLKKNIRLKFWGIYNLTRMDKFLISSRVGEQLNTHWLKRRYDFLGILGQAMGLRRLNNPWTYFCTERVRAVIDPVIPGLPMHQNPEEMNESFKTNPRMELFGYWEMPG